MRMLEYTFEELPLFTDLGFSFAPVSGVAEISYDTDGTWTVHSISLEGARRHSQVYRLQNPASEMFEYKWQSLCRQSYPWLYEAIVDALESKSSVQDKVDKALAEESGPRGSIRAREALGA